MRVVPEGAPRRCALAEQSRRVINKRNRIVLAVMIDSPCLLSSSANEPPRKDDYQRPDSIKNPTGSARMNSQWIAAEYIFSDMLECGHAGEFVNCFQHNLFNRRTLHDFLPIPLIPNFTVMIFRFFKQSGHS